LPIAQILIKNIDPRRVIVTTDDALNKHEHLFKIRAFNHHITRRRSENAYHTVYARLTKALLAPTAFGIDKYVPPGVTAQTITIKRSGHKSKAVDAIQNFFIKQNVVARLSSLVAQAADELIMNAIFDAPCIDWNYYRRTTPRDEDFELKAREHVQVSIAGTDEYVVLCVADQFGSLTKQALLNFLSKDYQEEAYTVRKQDPGAGLGLNGVIRAGFSLLFLAKEGVRTDVMLFFPKSGSFKDFREGFRFLGVVAD
jgi:hypothetical protein